MDDDLRMQLRSRYRGRKDERDMAQPVANLNAATAPLDWRALVLAAVAGCSTFNPAFTLHGGVVICSLILLTKLGSSIKVTAADMWATAFAAFAALSLYWAVNHSVTSKSVLLHVGVLALYLSVRAIADSRRNLTVIATGYCIGCLYAVALLYQQNQGMAIVVELSNARYGIEGVNFNYLAYSLATGVALTVLLWATGPTHRAWRICLLVTAALFYLGIALSGTRGALAAIVGLLIWVTLYRFHHRLGLVMVYALIGLFSIAIVSGSADRPLAFLARGSVREDGFLAGRLKVWPVARRVFSEHLLFGIGEGGFRSVNPMGIGAHNVFLEIGAGLGIVGVCLFLATLFTAVISGTRSVDGRLRALLIGSFLTTVAPIYLSGHWELSAAAWVALAVISRIHVIADSTISRSVGAARQTRSARRQRERRVPTQVDKVGT